jgi:2'-5' RNA ligase
VGDEHIRLFAALELPGEVREALVGWRAKATDGIPSLRLLSPESLHVTLCFLGGRPAEEVPGISAAIDTVSELPPASLSLERAIWLPRRRPRVLAVSLDDAGGRLLAVQESLSRTLGAGGWYRPERRPFLGHVTVARVGRDGIARPPTLPAPPPLEFAGDRVTLFRSRLSPGGARYEALASVRLGGG